ncbi:unnamed protein product [Linum trigynum]|uniref:Uncharacterized protein n=1 Tax=Linum trigynum TaxID=586398 RepID=A0AAV2FBA7_9ROSI
MMKHKADDKPFHLISVVGKSLILSFILSFLYIGLYVAFYDPRAAASPPSLPCTASSPPSPATLLPLPTTAGTLIIPRPTSPTFSSPSVVPEPHSRLRVAGGRPKSRCLPPL